MRKFTVFLIVFSLIFSSVLSFETQVSAAEIEIDENFLIGENSGGYESLTEALSELVVTDDLSAIQKDFENEFKVFEESEVDVSIDISEEEVVLNASTEVTSTEVTSMDVANVAINYDLVDETITLNSEYLENDILISNEFTIEIVSVDGEAIVADFIDVETGEIWRYDSLEVNASAVPVFVYLLGGQLVRATIQAVSKNLLTHTLTIGKTVYKANKNSVARDALTKINFKGANFSVGSTGRNVNLSKGKFEHILQGHHPKYWNGTERGNAQGFFDPKISFSTIENYIKQTISSNAKQIDKSVKNLDGKAGQFEVFKKINGVNYVLRLNVDTSKKITVSTFYPQKTT